jgi:hypothetical protein
VLAVAAVVVGLSVGVWLVSSALSRGGPSRANRAEVSALEVRLTAIRDAVQPIAMSFTAATAPTFIDVGEYRTRIEEVRELVDSTNGLAASSEAALEIRDLIVTGGAQVVDGLDGALDALQSNDASATEAPDALVAEGIGSLQEAQARINEVLGRTTGNER